MGPHVDHYSFQLPDLVKFIIVDWVGLRVGHNIWNRNIQSDWDQNPFSSFGMDVHGSI